MSVDTYEPQRWFAWRPVRTRDDGWAWGRWVWRTRYAIVGDSWWSYRAAPPAKGKVA